tara:strand:- start:455 stop:862 length:408 start_codon:yes stop_codon:yes gene_type:complete
MSPEEGPYESIKDTKESIQQNLIFLLQTIPGEWPMNPDLGVGLVRYLFEGYNSLELGEFEDRLKKQTKKYLPQVEIVKAEFISTPDDQDFSSTILRINYTISSYGVLEELAFSLDSVKKTIIPASSEGIRLRKTQ